MIYPCFWGSVSEKKVSFTGAFSLFSGVGWGWGLCLFVVAGVVLCRVGVVPWWCGVVFTSWCGAVLVWCCVGAVVGWGRGCCVVGWGCAGASLCRGGPVVVGPFSSSLKNAPRENPTGRVGIGAVHIFESTPPYIVPWLGWAGVGCVKVVDLTKRKPRVITTQGEVIEVEIQIYSVGSVGSVSLVAGSYLNLQILPPICW